MRYKMLIAVSAAMSTATLAILLSESRMTSDLIDNAKDMMFDAKDKMHDMKHDFKSMM